jgi:PPOX class probable FMN-dependent enzyme
MTSLAPWRSLLSQALERNCSLAYARYLQLATVRADGRPANRTLVFRGFLADTARLKFVTDARTQKIAEIEHQPWAEACWYFPQTREQFRITGALKLVKADCADVNLQQARQISWQELSEAARLQFAWPDSGRTKADAAAFEPPLPPVDKPLPNFCLLLLEPVQVDHLELRGEPQNRTIYSWCDREQSWSTQAVNP